VSGKYLLTPSEGDVICGFVLSLALSYLFIVLSCKGTESLKNPQTFMLGVG
jgi:lipoprotein